ncbi:MAG: SLBB domain-containing protein [Elusimicrobia bacterium]|nr:SLBB domain-containing protein [Elusimicrobiota bacterium]
MKTISLLLGLAFLPNLFPSGAFAQDMGNAPNPFQIETKRDQYVKTDVQSARKALPAERAALPPETSAYETFVSRDEGPEINQFGYDFFNKAPSTFAPADNVPVTSDYVVGPGDEIVISIWGKVDARFALEVSRDGNISIPKVGLVNVSGLTFSELKEALGKEIAKYYTDLNVNIGMGSLRSIRVYIVGNARVPGAYTISALSTMVTALFEAGGPSKTGSMRNIQLKRNGKLVSTLDLYELLLKGDKSRDARLVNEDVIFIPPVGPLAGISGDVKTPAIYELKDGDSLTDLIAMAGGFATTAFRGSVAMRRIFDHRFRDFYAGDLSEVYEDKSKDLRLSDGDLVKVFSIIEQDSAVNVAGAVAYPGKFGIDKDKTRLQDVIKLAGGLLPYASNEAELTRVKLSMAGVRTERFVMDISYLHTGAEMPPFLLDPNDHIMVKPISERKLYKMVKVDGEVRYPGVYTVKKGEQLSSILERAGGFTDNAYPRGIVFIRESAREQQQENLAEIAQRLEKQLLVEGSARMQTALSAEETASGKAEMEAKEKFVANLKQLKAQGRVYIKLNSMHSLKGSDYDIELEEEDSITIPARSSVVNVAGAVMAQGSYIYSSSSYGSYVNLAGGYADYSKPGKTFILKADGSARKARKCLFFSASVEPGDTIVVPERFDRIAWLREIRDFTQILMNVALTAGVVIKVF